MTDTGKIDALCDIHYRRGLEDGRAALDGVMRGGNHLANILIQKLGGDFATKYPPSLDSENAIRLLGPTTAFDVWCCWAAIMRARDAVQQQEAASK